MHLPAAVVTIAAVGRNRAARAVNLGAEGLGKPKWGWAWRNEIAVMMKIGGLCLLLNWMLW